MRTHVEFVSTHFPAYPEEDEEVNPDRFGRRLAEFFAAELPNHGFVVASIGAEDWGWMVELENPAFPLWVGYGNYDEKPNAFLCFTEPSTPFVRKWLSKIDTKQKVESLAAAMNAILLASDKVSELRWWTEDEIQT
jgi:hypothetical protein